MRPEPHLPPNDSRADMAGGQTPPREADLRHADSGVCAAGRSSTEADRVIAALDEAQARPCGWCEAEPRLEGDHLGKVCRALLRGAKEMNR